MTIKLIHILSSLSIFMIQFKVLNIYFTSLWGNLIFKYTVNEFCSLGIKKNI